MSRFELYLDYVNNFISVAGFASYYGMNEDDARKLIAEERTAHHARCDAAKTSA
mgnify:CR=1 FL=1